MLSRIKQKYEYTIYACYIGYITQAIVNNFVPLLFLTFSSSYNLSLDKITFITTINFAVQLVVDLLSAKFVDKIGYRVAVVMAHLFSAVGLISLAFLPNLLPNPYVGIIISVVLYALGGGLIEVLISPIVEACPTERKEAAMSLLHSFYCWGHVAVVLLSTAFFYAFGIENWNVLAIIWAIIPLANCLMFLQVPLYKIEQDGEHSSIKNLLLNKAFWIVMIVMLCAGASEQAMSQWASAFAESALGVSKTVGDLVGPCSFAIFMGTSRALYGKFSHKLSLTKAMVLCSCLCIGCYLLTAYTQAPIFGLIGCALCGFSVGIFWPGTFSIAPGVLGTGTALYALMALAGDVGCSAGPTVVGLVANAADGDLKSGLSVAIIFPIVILVGIILLDRFKKSQSKLCCSEGGQNDL